VTQTRPTCKRFSLDANFDTGSLLDRRDLSLRRSRGRKLIAASTMSFGDGRGLYPR
jgi:hypothetical protein